MAVWFLGFSLIAVIVVGGPGAVAFPAPALVWLAYSSSTWLLGLAIFGSGAVAILGNGTGLIAPISNSLSPALVISLRLGVALLSLAPLAVLGFVRVQQETVQALAHLVDTDSLTGLLNRRAVLARAEAELRNPDIPHVFYLIDLDQFKSVNDTFGHEAGDDALVTLAGVFREALPGNTLIGRIGGEEFALLVPGLTAHEGLNLAAQLQQQLGMHTSEKWGRMLTMSVGMTVVAAGDVAPLRDLMRIADDALYQAKHMGRNRVVTAQWGGRPPERYDESVGTA